MAMDLAALTALMGDQGANKTAQDELTTRMSEANALRGSTPEASKSLGFVSPLDVVSSIMNRSRGNKQKAELQPQLQAATRSVNDLASAKQQYGLNLAADKVRQDQTNVESLAGAKVQSELVKALAKQKQEKVRVGERTADQALTAQTLEDELAVDAQDEATRVAELGEKRGIEAGKRKGIMKINPETKEAESLTYDNQGVLRRNGKVVENPAAWKDYEKPTRSGGRGSGADSFNKPTAKQQKELQDAGVDIKSVTDVLTAFKPSYEGSGVPLSGTIANFISREAPIMSSDDMKAKQAWWADFAKVYELSERHEMFGAALTGTEKEQWAKASINPNMTAEQIAPKLAKITELKDKVATQLATNALLKGWDEKWVRNNLGDYLTAVEQGKGPESVEGAAANQIGGDLSITPEGIDPVEWKDMDDVERQEYYDLVIGEG